MADKKEDIIFNKKIVLREFKDVQDYKKFVKLVIQEAKDLKREQQEYCLE